MRIQAYVIPLIPYVEQISANISPDAAERPFGVMGRIVALLPRAEKDRHES
jgi:hypothetical protein